MTTKERLTLNQKTMELLQTKGNDKSKRIAKDHKMIIEYYDIERERYIRENKEICIEGLGKFAIDSSNELLLQMQQAVFN
nr:MAG TPA: Protein of unknown function (DUF2533) [Caudoviricetes sp.]